MVLVASRKQLIPYLLSHTQQKHFLALIADQSPNPKPAHHAIHESGNSCSYRNESIARDFDFMVYYASTRFVKRGEYACRFELLSEHPAEMKEGDLTVAFMKKAGAGYRRTIPFIAYGVTTDGS